MSAKFRHEYRAAVELWDLTKAIHTRARGDVRRCNDDWDTVGREVQRLAWCVDCELGGHVSYATFDFETGRADVAARRLAQTKAKLGRIVERIERSTRPGTEESQ